MIDLDPVLRERLALEQHASADSAPAIPIGRFAPHPVWLAAVLVVRAAQLGFLACFVWAMVALFQAVDGNDSVSLPPLWLWITTVLLGTSSKRGMWRWKTSPVGDAIANRLASQQCPACGQNVFDHTPPSGYAPDLQRHTLVPSRFCTNCGHDLKLRTAT